MITVGLVIEKIVGGQTLCFAENVEIPIADVGESISDEALLCRTDEQDCCARVRQGEWRYPNGTLVRTRWLLQEQRNWCG